MWRVLLRIFLECSIQDLLMQEYSSEENEEPRKLQNCGLSNQVIVFTEMWGTHRGVHFEGQKVGPMPIRYHPGGTRKSAPDLSWSSGKRQGWEMLDSPSSHGIYSLDTTLGLVGRQCPQGKDQNQDPSTRALKKLEVRKKKRGEQIYTREKARRK